MAWRQRQRCRPWPPEPGMRLLFDWVKAHGLVDGRTYSGELAWSLFRATTPIRHCTPANGEAIGTPQPGSLREAIQIDSAHIR
jgi:hypothetical protein